MRLTSETDWKELIIIKRSSSRAVERCKSVPKEDEFEGKGG
jgi:hypothetical protein